MGASMGSETTAAATGKVGVLRHDPMAMLPFCGYNMGDYFRHWLEVGAKLSNPPRIFKVNWFRLDENGRFMWPGFGDNMRVLLWILARCEGKVDAIETMIGYSPRPEDINIEGLEGFDRETLAELLKVDPEAWVDEIKGIREYFSIFDRLPQELADCLAELEAAGEKA